MAQLKSRVVKFTDTTNSVVDEPEITVSGDDLNLHKIAKTGNLKDTINNTASNSRYEGTVYFTNIDAITITGSSDVRLKKNIKPFEPKGSILDLPVVEFDYIDNEQHHIGCIAQELQEICPEIVHENCNGFLHIEESKLVYLLLLEVKKLRKELNELKGDK